MSVKSIPQLERLPIARAPRRSRQMTEHLAVSLFAVGLLWPLVWVALNGLSLTGSHEENLGYRYFYTLRELHEGATYLFLPQGQFANLIFKLVHIALDLAGLPPTQLHPRIEYFYIGSIAIFQMINISAFAYLLRQSPAHSNPALISVFWLLPFYASGYPASFILLVPDYLALEPAIAMLSAAALLKAQGTTDWKRKHYVGLTILLAVAAATKITLVIFPGITLLYLALTTRPLSRSITTTASVLLAVAGIWLLILYVDVSFGTGHLFHQLEDLEAFVRSGGGGIEPAHGPWILWLWSRASDGPLMAACIYLTPLFGTAALALARGRKRLAFLSSLLAGALAYSLFLYRRDYSITLIEDGFFSLMFLWCVWCAILYPAIRTWPNRFSSDTRLWSRVLTGGAVIILAAHCTQQYASSNLSFIARATDAERRLEHLTQQVKGRRLWLVPDNTERPLSVESAIMKGGSGSKGIWLEPDSPLMRRAFPDLDFRFERADKRPVELEEYAAVFFLTTTDLGAKLRQLNSRYRIDLFRLDCKQEFDMIPGMLVMCVHGEGKKP